MNSPAWQRLREWEADTAVVLGSGLNALVAEAHASARLPFGDFPELPVSRVPGHAGSFVRGEIGGRPLIFAQGRAHLYEGYSAQAVTAGIRLLAQAGVRRVILTNAAGTVNPKFPPGSWMMLSDHLNLTGCSPLAGAAEFVDLTEAYSLGWRRQFLAAAQQLGLHLPEGVYAGVCGPQYETPAEIRMLRLLGADAVGMSTVLETIQARALGLEVAGFSCLTNWAAGMGHEKLSHADVLEVGRAAAQDFARLLEAATAIGAGATR